MGLFGSRRVTQVGTGMSRVMEDKTLPNSLLTGSIKALQMSDGQPIEHAMEELTAGLGFRVHQLYKYAKTKYKHGLPSGTTMTNLVGRDTIIAVIEEELNADIGLVYYHVGPLNMLHLGWHLLVKNHDYDSRDNSLIVNGKKVYLTDMQAVVVEATVAELESGSMDMWGVSPTSGTTPLRKYAAVEGHDKDRPVFIVDGNATADYLRVKYCYEVEYTKVVEGVNVPAKRVEEAQFNLSVEGWDMSSSYHQAKYELNGKSGYWMYRMESGDNPEVEAIFDTAAKPDGTFFPMVYFRYDKKKVTEADPGYASSVKMLKLINLKFEDAAKAIDENPDIGDVEQAMLVFAVPTDSKAEVDRHYLFDFFNNLWTGAQESNPNAPHPMPEEIQHLMDTFGMTRPASTIVIQDKKFKMALSWESITKRRVTGKVAEVGHYAANTPRKDDKKMIIDAFGMEVELDVGQYANYYQYQVTESVYEEIHVVGLSMKYYVWGNYTSTGDENNDDILMVPLDYAITSKYTIMERELLYARSMHYVFNSRVVTKLKWYQTGIFRIILIIAAIVITVISNGLTWQTVVAAFASAAAFQAAVVTFLIWLAKYMVITYIFKKVVEIIGLKAAFIIALVAAATGMYQIVANGGLANAPWAAQLLQISTNLTTGMSHELKNEYRELENEFRSFKEFVDDKNEQMDMVNASLDGSLHLVPMIVWGETPDDFYQRTVHSGNIGVVGIEAVSSFVDNALTLPKLTDTLGDLYV